jgi:hypothetical protein
MKTHLVRNKRMSKRARDKRELFNTQLTFLGMPSESEPQFAQGNSSGLLDSEEPATTEPHDREDIVNLNPKPADYNIAANAGPDQVRHTTSTCANSEVNEISMPNTSHEIDYWKPEFRQVRIGLIDIHPLLRSFYSLRRTQFPPEVPLGYLTPKGIQTIARFSPIHLVICGARMQCFAGLRLWLAAQNSLELDAEIEALVYSRIEEDQVAEAIEMEQDILNVWCRQSEKERRALEINYVHSPSSNNLRETFDGTDQEKWQRILKISLKTLQNRLALNRRKA